MEVLPYKGDVPSWLDYRLPAHVSLGICPTALVTYAQTDSQADLVSFRADACDSTSSAVSTYNDRIRQLEGASDSAPLKPVPMESLGDFRVSYVREEPVSASKMRYVIVRTGRFVLTFKYGPISENVTFPKEIDTMIQTFVKKADSKPVG